MGLRQSVVTGLLVILLSLSLIGANAAVAAQRTALDPGFVTTTLSEENAYTTLHEPITDTVVGELAVDGSAVPIDPEPIIDEALPASYIEAQVDRNVERLLAYLHGNREELVLRVNLAPVKENATAAIAADIRDRSIPELLSLAGIEELGSVDVRGVSIDLDMIATMGESKQAYKDARRSFRADVRETVTDRLVEEAFATRSNDELLGLVIDDYDSAEYTAAEKDRMVADREDEIRLALRMEIEQRYGDRIDARMDEELAEYRDDIRPHVESGVADKTGDLDPAVTTAIVDLVMVGVDGLVTDMEYAAFRRQLAAAKAELADAVATVVSQRLSEHAPDRIDLTQAMGPGARQGLATAQGVVQLADILSVGLPVAALLALGALWFVSGSAVITLVGGGIGLVIAGVSGITAAAVVPPRTRAMVSMGGPVELGHVMVDVVDQVFAVVSTQSMILIVAGVIVCVASGLFHYGVVLSDSPQPD